MARRSASSSFRRFLHRLFLREEDRTLLSRVKVLAGAGLFQPFDASLLWPIAEVVHARAYRRDEVIYHEGDPGLGLYLVQRGRVVLTAEDADGHPQELREAGEGDAFGMLSLLGHFRRMDTARALSDVEVLGFFRPDLQLLLKRNPHAAAAVLAALARQIGERQEALVRTLGSETGRVAALQLLDGATAAPPPAGTWVGGKVGT